MGSSPTVCWTPYVYADDLERRDWEERETIIYDPSLIISRLDERANEEIETGYQVQLDYIERQLEELKKEQDKFETAYLRDIYTLNEFEEKMKDLRGKTHALEVSKSKVEANLLRLIPSKRKRKWF